VRGVEKVRLLFVPDSNNDSLEEANKEQVYLCVRFLLLFCFCGFFPNPGGSLDGGDDEFKDVRLIFSNSCC
jgi:hypothetical protein